nr:ribonuclease H-like domain-containing protein [Tanacetum cinerariifolium]
MKRFKNAIFKQREEINNRMTELFGLHKELTVNKPLEKVLIRDKARHPITKHVNSISLVRTVEEESTRDEEMFDDICGKPDKSKVVISPKEVDKEKEAKNVTRDNLFKSTKEKLKKIDEEKSGETPNSHYVYLVDFVILDIKEDEKRPFILGTPFLATAKSVIKFDKGTITLRFRKSNMSFYRIPESLCKIVLGLKDFIESLLLSSYKSAKSLMEAIEKRSEGLDQIYDRLQKLISQLEIYGETISQEDLNQKLLRNLPSDWKTHTLIWRNKLDLETLSMDDLYNNLKIYEAKVMGSSSTTQNTQNIAFVSSNNTDSTNKAVNTSQSVSVASSKTNASNLPNVDSLSDAEIDFKWQMAMLTMRARIFLQKKGRNLGVKGTKTIGFDKTKVECYNYHRTGLESVEVRLEVYKKKEAVFEKDIKILKLDVMFRDKAIIELRHKFEKSKKERDALKLTLEMLEGYDSQGFDSQVLENQMNDKYNTSEGYHAVLPPYTGNFMPFKLDLVFSDEHVVSDSKDEDEIKTETKQIKPSFAKVKFIKPTEHVKSPRKSVKQEKSNRKTKYPRKNNQSPRVVRNKKRNEANVVKALACSIYRPKQKVLDHVSRHNGASMNFKRIDYVDAQGGSNGCSWHMTGNKSYLFEYEEIDGGYVAFRGDPKEGIENLIDHKVKIIRCDNRPEFKNKDMNQLCEMKGIRREFSVTRTPQQIGVAERKNRTLIKDPAKEGDKNDQEKDVRDKEEAPRKQFEQESKRLFGQREDANTNSTNKLNTVSSLVNADANDNMMFTPVSAARSTYVYLGGSIPVNAATLLNANLPTNPFMPNLEDTANLWIMDVNSAFLYGIIEEEVCVCQPPGFEDPHFPNKVYKVEKALYGLHKAPRSWYETLSTYLSENRFRRGIIDKTLFIKKDKDSDYAGASLDRKSITRGCQFLRKRLISWQCKKQIVIANLTTKAEYVAAANYYGQNLEVGVKFFMFPRFVQVFVNHQLGDMSHHKKIFVTPSLTKKDFANMEREGKSFSGIITPLFEIMMVQALEEVEETKIKEETKVPHTKPQTKNSVLTTSNDQLPGGMDRLQLTELMDLCTNLLKHVLDLKKAKTAQAKEIADLKKRVKKLERKKKSRTLGLKRLWKIGSNTRERINKEDTFRVNDLDGDEVIMDVTAVTTAEDVKVTNAATPLQISKDELTLAQNLIEIKAAKPKERGVIVQEPSELRTTSYSQPSKLPHAKDKGDKHEQESAKRQKLEKEDDTVELKRCLEIIPEDDDDVTIKSTHLSSKSLTIVDYKIYKEWKKSYFKIIKADGNSQSYLTFRKMFKNFNRDDLKVLWSIIKERFKKTRPVDDMENLLFQTLQTMFEHHVEDDIWKSQ